MHRDADRLLSQLAAHRHGLFGTSDIRRLRFTPATVRQRRETGQGVAIYDGVYRMAGVPLTWRGALLAACLAGGAQAVASHRSAAALWGFPGGDENLQELMCLRWRRTRHGLLVVHESKVLAADDVTTVDAIPTTTAPRTLLDLGAVRGPATVERAVEAALRRELTTLDDLRAIVDRLGRRGRNGVGVLRAVLDARHPDRGLTESDMEMLLLQVLRANGLPEPVPQYEIWHQGRFIARVDGALVAWKVSIEYESYQYHTGKQALVRDSARRNAQIAIGWKPISVTWEDLRSGGFRVCADIRAAMCPAA